jgi:hypothetical protein
MSEMPDAGHRCGRPLGLRHAVFFPVIEGLTQVEAALHSAEKQRIAALRSYEILDTPREEEFDDIVRVVSAICETPISVINLIDHGRQWFKAEVQAIAAVHQQLHLAGSLEFIEIGSFLKSLCENLKQTAPACIDAIETRLGHAEIRSDQASTLGLITAELLANCFKHAYPNAAHGPVSVGRRPASLAPDRQRCGRWVARGI